MEGQKKHFAVVRRGYNTDEVDKFLQTQADAWAAELDDARAANEDLEKKLQVMQTQIDRVKDEEADIAKRLEDAGRAYDDLTAKADRETLERRRLHDDELTQLRAEATTYAANVRAEAETEAAKINKQAKKTVSEADLTARSVAESVLEEHQEVLNKLQSDFDDKFARTKAQYQRVLTALQAKVDELTETHQGLVSGLEAIANGGLAVANLDDLGELPSPNLGGLNSNDRQDAPPPQQPSLNGNGSGHTGPAAKQTPAA